MEGNNSSAKKIRVAYISMFAAVFIVGIKLLASILSGSLAVLSELFHSSTDLFACIITIISIKYSSLPPDKDHNYGHEKVESFSALVQVLILVIMCGYVFYEAIDRLYHPPVINIDYITFSVILICIFIDYSRSKALKKVAVETKSQALEADALHFSSDILSSIVVLGSMVFTFLGFSQKMNSIIDSVAAIIVSIIIVVTTIRLTKKAIDSLMDRVPAGLYDRIISDVEKIDGIESIKVLRIRGAGSKTFIDMTVLINRIARFSMAHDYMDKVENAIQSIAPDADIVIHSEPVKTENESVNDSVALIVDEFGLKCHDIFTHYLDDGIFTELHIEVENINDLNKAHNLISEVEMRIRSEIKGIKIVQIHIDEPSGIIRNTADVTSEYSEISNIIEKELKKESATGSFKDIRVLKANNKLRVSFSCVFNNNQSFDEVHDLVTLLESKIYLSLKEIYTNLSNVIIHAEPN